MSLLGLDRGAAVHVQASRLKTAAPFASYDGFELPVTMRTILGWPFRFEVGEFMRTFIASVAVFATLTGYPAFAEETVNEQPTRIEIDQQAKAFTFIIDDKAVATLDQSGLHVLDSITYGGTLTDNGSNTLKSQSTDSTEAADE